MIGSTFFQRAKSSSIKKGMKYSHFGWIYFYVLRACCPWQGHAAHGRGMLPMAGASPATTIYESVGWRSRRIVVAGLAPAMSRAAMPRAAMSLAHVTESQQYVTESQRRSLVS